MFLLLTLFGLCLVAGPAAAAEEPPYSVVLHEGSFEIRDYPALALAEVTAPGDRNSARTAASEHWPATFSAATRAGRASK
jgi:hypothetical protein